MILPSSPPVDNTVCKVPRVTLPEEIERRISRSACCWLWTGTVARRWDSEGVEIRRAIVSLPDPTLLTERSRTGRGLHRTTTVARVVLEVELGRVLETREQALHRCDEPLCVRPDHLFLGTARDNTRDALAKGRLRPGGKPVGKGVRTATTGSPFVHTIGCLIHNPSGDGSSVT